MTPESIRQRIEEIRKVSHDSESAHGMEDGLLSDVLAAVAAGDCSPSPEACARAALEVKTLDFKRWNS